LFLYRFGWFRVMILENQLPLRRKCLDQRRMCGFSRVSATNCQSSGYLGSRFARFTDALRLSQRAKHTATQQVSALSPFRTFAWSIRIVISGPLRTLATLTNAAFRKLPFIERMAFWRSDGGLADLADLPGRQEHPNCDMS